MHVHGRSRPRRAHCAHNRADEAVRPLDGSELHGALHEVCVHLIRRHVGRREIHVIAVGRPRLTSTADQPIGLGPIDWQTLLAGSSPHAESGNEQELRVRLEQKLDELRVLWGQLKAEGKRGSHELLEAISATLDGIESYLRRVKS